MITVVWGGRSVNASQYLLRISDSLVDPVEPFISRQNIKILSKMFQGGEGHCAKDLHQNTHDASMGRKVYLPTFTPQNYPVL